MSETIIERFTCSKTNNEKDNEDGLFIDDNYIAVIDGATSKSPALFGHKTGGRFVRDCIIDSLSRMHGDENCANAIQTIQKNIISEATVYKSLHASATAIIYSRSLKQLWAMGDCQALIDSFYIKNEKEIDRVLSEARAMAICALLDQGKTVEELRKNDFAREFILPFLKLQKQFENKSGRYGYSVFNTESAPNALNPRVYNVPSGSTVVLASDGYPVLKETLALSESTLKEIIEADPLMYKIYPSTKGVANDNVSFDDRTYIRFFVN